jgi:hypothetical protein
MSSRLFIYILGVLPATVLAFFVLVLATEGMASAHLRFDQSMVVSFLFESASISGTVALWIVATRSAPFFRGKKDALVLGIMLLSGMAAAGLGLQLPSALLRLLIICPIVVALSLFPSIWRTIRRKEGSAGVTA